MPTITNPAASSPIAVTTRQPLHLTADAAVKWSWINRNDAVPAWTTLSASATEVVFVAPSSVNDSDTFDRIEIAIGSNPDAPDDTLHLNLCQGPVAVLQVTDREPLSVVGDPPLQPWTNASTDDPPRETPLLFPGANRDGFATCPLDDSALSGGPINAIASFRPGLLVDTNGQVQARTRFTAPPSGLGPFPPIASFHLSGATADHGFGTGRTLSLTRVLKSDATRESVTVVRGDGRRNTYRYYDYDADGTRLYESAAGQGTTLLGFDTLGYGEQPFGVSPYGGDADGGWHELCDDGRRFAYDDQGKLISAYDRAGNEISYAYDANGRLQKLQSTGGTSGLVPYLSYDANGRLERLVLEDALDATNNRTSYFQYDGSGQLTKLVGPESCTTYFAYSGGHLQQVEDPEGFSWTLAFDANDRVTQITDARNESADFTFDTSNHLATFRDRGGKATYFEFNALGQPTAVFNVGTPADYYGYDTSSSDPGVSTGSLISAKNRLGEAWTFEYDPRANRIAVNDPLMARTYHAYDTDNRVVEEIDPLGDVNRFGYDAQRNRTSWTDAKQNNTYFEFQDTGLLHFKKDRRGAFTYFEFDSAANLIRVTDALGNQSDFVFNSAGERTAARDPLLRTSYFDYDQRGRLIKSTDPVGGATYFDFDARCNLIAQTDANLNTTDFSYDGNSNRIRVTNALGQETYFGFDANDLPTLTLDARNNPTYVHYDALNRPERQVDAFLNTTTLVFDDAHQLEKSVDPRGNATYFRYDVTGRTTHQKNALLEETYFGFDLDGQQKLVTDGLDQPTYFTYDELGRQLTSKDALGNVTESTFDEEGNQLRSIDPRGNTTYFTYDLLGRQTEAKDQLGNVRKSFFDAASQLEKSVDALGSPTYFTYDDAGRIEATKDAFFNETYTGYDLAGNQVLSLDQAGFPTYFEHDVLNRQFKTKDAFFEETYLCFDAVGNTTISVDEVGEAIYFTYDRLNRQTHQEDSVHFQPTYTGYDAVGNAVLDVDAAGFAAYFTFDRLNRVEFGHDRAGALSYHAFDAAGNQTQSTVLLGAGGERRDTYFSFDEANRQTHVEDALGGVTYVGYDKASNVILRLDAENRPTYFGFDELNRQNERKNALGNAWTTHFTDRSEVEKTIDPVGRTSYFSYDRLGRKTHESNALGEVTYMGFDARSNEVLRTLPPEGGKLGLFWTDDSTDFVRTCSLEGGTQSNVVASGTSPTSIAVDLLRGGKVYWTGPELMKRANLDGTDVETILSGSTEIDDVNGLVVSGDLGVVFFHDGPSGELRRCNLDGSDYALVSSTLGMTGDFALDVTAKKIYYGSGTKIRTCDLDGSNVDDVVTGVQDVQGIAVDSFGQKLYWADRGTNNHIRRADLDGANAETLATGLTDPAFLRLDNVWGRLYWIEHGTTNTIKTSELDGSNPSTLVSQSGEVVLMGLATATPPKTARFEFDRLSRRTHVTDAYAGVQYFGYDAVGNVVKRIDERGNESVFTFDGLRRMETAKDPLAKVTTFEYDERSLLKKRVSPAAEAGTAYFDHDGAGRVVKQFFTKVGGGADADIDFTYDEVGNLTLVEDDSGADTVQEFDKLNRMTKKVNVAGAVYFEWDASGKRAQTKNPSLDKTTNNHDDLGRLHFVAVSAGGSVRRHYYHYDDSNMPTKKILQGNKVMSYYTWDDAGRLEQLQNLDDGASVLSYFNYTRNAVGAEVFVRHEAAGLSYFEHDALDRLTHERRVDSGARNFDKTFEYDATSNRTLEDDGVSGENTYYTYNVANLLTSTKQLPTINPVTFEYDDAQRMTAEKDAGDQSTYFTYDQRDQPIQLDFKGGIPDDTREFTFTGTGERAIVKTDTTPSYFAYDGSKLLEQRDTSGAAVFTYRHNDSFLDQMGSILEIDQALGSLLFFPGFDQNGSTVTFVEDGGVFGPYESAYDFFGSVIFSDNESGQQARAFSPVMVDLDLSNTQIMTPVAGSALLLTNLAILVPGKLGRIHAQQAPGKESLPIPLRSKPPSLDELLHGSNSECQAGKPILHFKGESISALEGMLASPVYSKLLRQAWRSPIFSQERNTPKATGPYVTKRKATRGRGANNLNDVGGWIFYWEFPVNDPEGRCALRYQEQAFWAKETPRGNFNRLPPRFDVNMVSKQNEQIDKSSYRVPLGPNFQSAMVFFDVPSRFYAHVPDRYVAKIAAEVTVVDVPTGDSKATARYEMYVHLSGRDEQGTRDHLLGIALPKGDIRVLPPTGVVPDGYRPPKPPFPTWPKISTLKK